MFVKIYHTPRAWMHEDGWLTRSEQESIRWTANFPGEITPLYSADQVDMKREPLSETMAEEVIKKALLDGVTDPVALVRAIEAAHGIG